MNRTLLSILALGLPLACIGGPAPRPSKVRKNKAPAIVEVWRPR